MHGPARSAADLRRSHGVRVAPATVQRVLVRRGLNRLRDRDPPTGKQLRDVIRYEHDRVGDLIHADIRNSALALVYNHSSAADAAFPSTTRSTTWAASPKARSRTVL